MANYLLLNQPQVFNGLGTMTYVVPTGTDTQLYTVQVQTTFPSYPAVNSVPSSTVGVGANVFPTVPLGAGSGMGLGAGTGGGGTGFTKGDQGTGQGGVGQGFGTGNSYQQPPSAASNATASSAQGSSLSIVVAKDAVTQYTSTAPVATQGGLQFATTFSAAAGSSITVVLSSSASVDNQLSGITSTISIQQGF